MNSLRTPLAEQARPPPAETGCAGAGVTTTSTIRGGAASTREESEDVGDEEEESVREPRGPTAWPPEAPEEWHTQVWTWPHVPPAGHAEGSREGPAGRQAEG